MSIVGPVLFAGIMIIYIMLMQVEDRSEKSIAVIDNSQLFATNLADNQYLKFQFLPDSSLEKAQNMVSENKLYALLVIPNDIVESKKITIYSYKQPTLDVEMYITEEIKKFIERTVLRQTLEKEFSAQAIEASQIETILNIRKTSLDVKSIKWSESGEAKESSTGLVMAIGYISGLVIYMFVFVYGAMVMRGVIEEKTSRIVEIIVSSVRPFQLMMGKIIGIGMVGLTQFIIWIVLTTVITGVGQAIFVSVTGVAPPTTVDPAIAPLASASNPAFGFLNAFQSINFIAIISLFIVYFIGGYLIYASLFAAIGSAVDNESDTQQFMLPLTAPLILAIMLLVNVMQNPAGAIARIFSLIPLTSPVVMMVRIPFGIGKDVPYWELALSIFILFLTFVGTTWVAAKIYRTGILMYGKKASYKELWKWLRYKN